MGRALLLLAATALAGCTSNLIADNLPASVGGLPESVPPRVEAPAAFPAVHDRPPARADTTLTEAERKRLKEDLIATRDRAARSTQAAEKIRTTENTKKTKKTNKKAEKADPVTTGSTSAAGGAVNP